MGIQKDQIRKLIQSILRYLSPEIEYSEDAVELLMLTAAQESHLGSYIEQLQGPAKGIFQMEPTTEKDLWDNFLTYHHDLAKKIDDLKDRTVWTDDLLANLNYQIAMVRVHYYRIKEPLPGHKIVGDMAAYYKKYYNTVRGKATIQKAIDSYREYCA